MDRDDDMNVERRTSIDSSTTADGEHHATTGGAAAAGAVTGGVIGLTGGPIGAAIGAVGGAIVGAAAERMMHSDDDAERARAGYDNDRDGNPMIEDRSRPASREGDTETALNPADEIAPEPVDRQTVQRKPLDSTRT